MPRTRPPYFLTASTEKTAERLKMLQRLGRHSTLCAGKACDKNTYWLLDIVVAQPGYGLVAGAARRSALANNRGSSSTVVLCVKAPRELVETLDNLARRHGTTRSQLVREAITLFLTILFSMR